MNLTELLTAIANAIRSKKGTTATINAQNFPTEINSIQVGTDVSDTTAVASNVDSGKIFHLANGNKATGTSTKITPSGTKSITSNGTVDVTNYASANVNVPNPTLKTETQSQTYQLGGGAGFVSKTFTFSTLTKVIGIYNFDDNSGSWGGLGDNKPIFSFSGNTMTMKCSSASGASFTTTYKVTVIGW